MTHYITDTRASEIRKDLCEKHGAQWLHHYHQAIEAEVIRNLPELKLPTRSIRWSELALASLIPLSFWLLAWWLS